MINLTYKKSCFKNKKLGLFSLGIPNEMAGSPGFGPLSTWDSPALLIRCSPLIYSSQIASIRGNELVLFNSGSNVEPQSHVFEIV